MTYFPNLGVLNAPTQDDLDRLRERVKKPMPHQVVKADEKKTKADKDAKFRLAVWKRDEGKSRATGKPLVKSGLDWHALGEVDHSIPRSLAPERIYDVSNGLLLSKWENRMRKVACREQPEYRVFDYTGPDDRSKPQRFVWRDPQTGKITKERKG